jgi:hypothetical protein
MRPEPVEGVFDKLRPQPLAGTKTASAAGSHSAQRPLIERSSPTNQHFA